MKPHAERSERNLRATLGSETTQSLQLTRRSHKSWLGDDEDDTNDPFAEIGDDFSGDVDDLEANLIRDKRATLYASISRIVDLLQPSASAAALVAACDELVSLRGLHRTSADSCVSWDCWKMLQKLGWKNISRDVKECWRKSFDGLQVS